jgi:hypothetical protein
MKVLHPDATPTAEDRQKAVKAFSGWWSDSKAAARR